MRHHPPFWLVTLLTLISIAPARAQQPGPEPDTFKFRVDYALQTDSNLQRLSASDNVLAKTGRSSTAERIGISTLGVSFNKAYSLQRLELDLSLVDHNYQNFSQYSYTATNYAAAWRWSFTPRLRGSLTSDRNQTLNSFSDYQSGASITKRNLRTTRNTGFEASFDVDGTWSMLAGLARTHQANQQTLGTGEDYSANTASMGVRRASGSNSTLTYNLKTASGKYLNTANNREFDQLDHELRLFWVLTGSTTANLSATYINRSHPDQPLRDYSGFNTGAAVNWSITGKTALAVNWARQLGSYQTGYSNYAQSDRLSLGPIWRIGSKTYLGLRYDLTHINYLGTPPTPSVPTALREDTLRDLTLSFNWQPYQFVALSAALKKSTRDATVANLDPLDYRSTTGTLSADFSF